METSTTESVKLLRVRDAASGSLIGERIQLCNTSQTRRRGLLQHQALGEGEGILLSPCEGVHTFGMQFPIDIIFLDGDHCVVGLHEAVRPGRVRLCLRAHSTLELAAGSIAKLGLAKLQPLTLERVTLERAA